MNERERERFLHTTFVNFNSVASNDLHTYLNPHEERTFDDLFEWLGHLHHCYPCALEATEKALRRTGRRYYN